MLNPFPILFLTPFAYLLMRFCLGTLFIYLALTHWHYRQELKSVLRLSWFPFGTFVTHAFVIVEFSVAIFLLFGFNTQYAALIIMAMSLKLIILKSWFLHPSLPSRMSYALIFVMALSLFITGAGAFAVDLPI